MPLTLPPLPAPGWSTPAEHHKALVAYLSSVADVGSLLWLADPNLPLLAQRELVRRLSQAQTQTQTRAGASDSDSAASAVSAVSAVGASEDSRSSSLTAGPEADAAAAAATAGATSGASTEAATQARLQALEESLTKLRKHVRALTTRQAGHASQLQQQAPVAAGSTSAAVPPSSSTRSGTSSAAAASKVHEVIQLTNAPLLSPTAPASSSSLDKLKREAQQRNKVLLNTWKNKNDAQRKAKNERGLVPGGSLGRRSSTGRITSKSKGSLGRTAGSSPTAAAAADRRRSTGFLQRGAGSNAASNGTRRRPTPTGGSRLRQNIGLSSSSTPPPPDSASTSRQRRSAGTNGNGARKKSGPGLSGTKSARIGSSGKPRGAPSAARGKKGLSAVRKAAQVKAESKAPVSQGAAPDTTSTTTSTQENPVQEATQLPQPQTQSQEQHVESAGGQDAPDSNNIDHTHESEATPSKDGVANAHSSQTSGRDLSPPPKPKNKNLEGVQTQAAASPRALARMGVDVSPAPHIDEESATTPTGSDLADGDAILETLMMNYGAEEGADHASEGDVSMGAGAIEADAGEEALSF